MDMRRLVVLLCVLGVIGLFLFWGVRMLTKHAAEQESLKQDWWAKCRKAGGIPVHFSHNQWECFSKSVIVEVK